MADQPHRRAAKPFEPPPWEKEQFEELARERERAAEEAAVAEAERADADAEGSLSEEHASAIGAEGAVSADSAHEAGKRVDSAQEGREAADEPDAANVDAMLMALRAEEPDPASEVWKVGMVAGLFLTAMGLVLVVWSGVALARTLESGPTAYLGAGVMGLMGAGLVALGVWLVVRSLRKQGVL